ncbi:MAG: MFS transporter [Asgard group archaeon]|nr:MFS transporter [Asgard group archaeon]
MADEMFETAETAIKAGDIDPTSIESKETRKGNAVLWFFYDAADTYFSQLILSLAYSPFALLLGIKLGWSYTESFLVMSAFMAFSNLLIAIFGPVLGSFSDTLGKRKIAVIISAGIMIGTTAAISGVALLLKPEISDAWQNDFVYWMTSIFFVIANFCYQAGRMFYDAQIPFVAKTEERSVTQAIGGSLAFLGSVLAVVTNMVVVGILGKPTHADTAIWIDEGIDPNAVKFGALPWLFIIGAVIILIMSIPYLFHKEVENPKKISTKENFKQSFQTFRTTGKEILKDKNSILFFLSWFFITDAANTAILYMAVVIQGAVGYGTDETNYVIFAGIGGSLIFAILTGFFMKRYGPKLSFIVNGAAWAIAIIIIMFAGLIFNVTVVGNITYIGMLPQWIMFVGAFFIGVGFGGIWIIGRQFIMVLAPPQKLAQYGGFQKIAGRVSAIVSPLLFSGTMFLFTRVFSESHNPVHFAYRAALGQLLLFFIIGVILLFFIRDPHKRYLTGERAPYPGIYDKKKK